MPLVTAKKDCFKNIALLIMIILKGPDQSSNAATEVSSSEIQKPQKAQEITSMHINEGPGLSFLQHSFWF